MAGKDAMSTAPGRSDRFTPPAARAELDLAPFCGTDPERPYLHKPFSRGAHTYATDGRIMIRVPRRADVPEGKIAAEKAADKITKIPNARLLLRLPRKPKGRWEECEDCNGRGTEHDCDGCDHACSSCNGEGQVRSRESASVGIGNAAFDIAYIRLILPLPGLLVYDDPEIDDALPFTFAGGWGALMPIINGKRERHFKATLEASERTGRASEKRSSTP